MIIKSRFFDFPLQKKKKNPQLIDWLKGIWGLSHTPLLGASNKSLFSCKLLLSELAFLCRRQISSLFG